MGEFSDWRGGTNYGGFSLADLSAAHDYKQNFDEDSRKFNLQNSQKQQEINFQNPESVQVPYNSLSQVATNPQTTYGLAARDAMGIQENQPRLMPNKDGSFSEYVRDPKTGQSYIRPIDQGKRRGPAYEPDQTQEYSEDFNPQVFQTKAAFDLASRQAKMYGGTLDPQTGSVTLPGHIGMEVLKNLQPHVAGDVADMYKAVLRPAPAAPISYPPNPPQNRSSGAAAIGRTPYDKSVSDAFNAMKMSGSAVSGPMGMLATPEQQKQAQDDAKYYKDLEAIRRKYLEDSMVGRKTNQGASAPKGSQSVDKSDFEARVSSGELVEVRNKKTGATAYKDKKTGKIVNVK